MKDADQLLANCGSDFDEVKEYQLLVRLLSKQTVVEDAVRRLRKKADLKMNSSMLQNPSDPDATYRVKAGNEYTGYVANIDETVGANGSVITDYQLEKNNYSDSQFFKDSMERNGAAEEEATIVADGAYFGEKMKNLLLKTIPLWLLHP